LAKLKLTNIDTNYFVVTKKGRLYNSAMNLELEIETITQRDYFGYQFSEDGQKLYCFGLDGAAYVDKIDKWSFIHLDKEICAKPFYVISYKVIGYCRKP